MQFYHVKLSVGILPPDNAKYRQDCNIDHRFSTVRPHSIDIVLEKEYLVSQKIYTRLSKRNLKSVTSINDMLVFLDCTQSDLNFEPSFIEIRQVLREIWLLKHEFQARNFGQLRIFGGIKCVNKLYIKLLKYFHRNLTGF